MANNRHLSQAEVEEFRRMLVEKRQSLLRDLGALKAEQAQEHEAETPGGGLSDVPTHLAEHGTDAYEREIGQRILQTEEDALLEIDDALTRIESGAYGLCAATGKPISRQRLRAVPWAKYCVEVAERAEAAG